MGSMSARLDPVDEVVNALQRSGRRVRLGQAPPAQPVQGPLASVWDTITKVRASARSEILGIDDTGYLLDKAVPDAIQRRGPATLRAALGRGARVRQVTSRAGLLADQELGAIVYRAGGEARVVDQVPLKVSIIDRRVAMLPFDLAVLANGFQIVRDPKLVAALVTVHQSLWGAGDEPLGLDRDLPPRHLAGVVSALASGVTDETAAGRLGLSPRTYSRRVAEVMTMMGAHNRFQAGVEATRRGWL